MRPQLLSEKVGYVLVGALSVAAAILLSFHFLNPLRAQETTTPPSSATPAAAPLPEAKGKENAAQEKTEKQGESKDEEEESQGGKSVSDLEGFLEPFIYDVLNRRDPFQPYAEYVPQETGTSSRPLSPAQRFDLDQLKLVGIMWDVKEPRAMFMDPDQEVLILGRDEGIGNRNGYIATIREGEVVVVEAIRRRGDIIYKTRVLRIER